ncbi:TetR/AcrR family transcriptional regulator [[Ruminococcus] torques]|jgi:AcrR family transcriptional regulator|uniref:TetR/AcrR family transcriptional regulator n=1 Tax=[Ruminococcus] torques TaxID=33039 RepID=UPI0015C0502B|nr:TetR/AcrR family transcriptional regulator [[Ruminococcus] torques]MDM8236237.1 TetR/AcrR family transcriptional regulator [[Ruminococcus] torques]HJC80062.1 TetR/AcrR family transcriptional regulator [Candidatus Mediterraneibacter excrementipullorum]
MEDKRIVKTKRSLKAAMTEMLGKEDFEHISITELCRKAEISRITFYSHYSDKYALLDDIFNDMQRIGTEDYYRRQAENNPSHRLAAGYVNMLDSILELYYDRFDFFQHTNPEKNPYLASRFYSIVLETVEQHTLHVKKRLRIKYSPKKIAGFVCFGMLGFVNESHKEKTPLEEIKKEARELLTDLLKSGVLTESETEKQA